MMLQHRKKVSALHIRYDWRLHSSDAFRHFVTLPEKYTLLILHCCWCPALALKPHSSRPSQRVAKWQDQDVWVDGSPRKNGTDRKFMTLNYIKVTSSTSCQKNCLFLEVFFFNYINTPLSMSSNEKIFLVYCMIIQMFQKYTLDHPGIRKI